MRERGMPGVTRTSDRSHLKVFMEGPPGKSDVWRALIFGEKEAG
jgi:hypothetical protein